MLSTCTIFRNTTRLLTLSIYCTAQRNPLMNLYFPQSEDFKLFHHDTVHKLQKQLAEKQSVGPVKMGPVPKGVPNGAPPPGRSEAGPGVSRHAEVRFSCIFMKRLHH